MSEERRKELNMEDGTRVRLTAKRGHENIDEVGMTGTVNRCDGGERIVKFDNGKYAKFWTFQLSLENTETRQPVEGSDL